MIEGKKISQLVETTKLNDACCFPVLSAGATRRITFSALVNNIVNALPESIDEQEIKEIRQKLNKHESEINELIIKGESIDEALNQIIFKVDGQDRTILEYTSVVQELKSVYEQATISGGVVDSSLNPDSINPVQNQVLAKLIPAEASVENKLADKASVNKKLDKTTNVENAGKAVVVDEEGNLTFGEAGVQVSQEEGNAIEEKDDGIYVPSGLSGVPIGTIVSWSSDNIPAGFLKFDGTTYNKSDYPVLYTRIPNEWKIDENTFKLPDLKDKFIQGANNNLGESIEAGLPNITGRFGALGKNNGEWNDTSLGGDTGAFTDTGIYENGKYAGASGSGERRKWEFKASKSNSIYKDDCDTVQPPAIALHFIIKATDYSQATEDVIDDTRATTGNVWSASKTKTEIENRTSLDWSNAVETVATNTNENTFNVTTDGILYYDLGGFNYYYCYVKINDFTIVNGTTNGNNSLVSKSGSLFVSKGDVIKWKEGYVGDFLSTHKIIFVPYKS